jgi:hypothetical protein
LKSCENILLETIEDEFFGVENEFLADYYFHKGDVFIGICKHEQALE